MPKRFDFGSRENDCEKTRFREAVLQQWTLFGKLCGLACLKIYPRRVNSRIGESDYFFLIRLSDFIFRSSCNDCLPSEIHI